MRILRALVAIAFIGAGAVSAAAQTPVVSAVPSPDTDSDAILRLLRQVEQVVEKGEVPRFGGLLAAAADRTRAMDFASAEIGPAAMRAVVHERDREPLKGVPAGEGYRLVVDVFAEFGTRARVATWRLNITRSDQTDDHGAVWRIADEERMSSLDNLYRLALNPAKQYAATNLEIHAEDLNITLAEGSVFVADIDLGVTGVVLLGKGTIDFHPAPASEKGQVKIFCGSETLETSFDAMFVRLNPFDVETVLDLKKLRERPVDARDYKRAQDLFREESAKSFMIDLGDLSRDSWSLLPGAGDFLAEMRTRRYDTLTYARSGVEAEDITLFDRKRHHNIALYPSQAKLAAHGRFYNEDDLVDYDVLDYDIDVTSIPDRQWIEGRTRIFLKARAYTMSTVTLRLADPLVVQSVVSNEFGRLFGVRIKNQNTLVVSLPTPLTRGSTLTLTIAYSGRLEAQSPDRETITVGDQRPVAQDEPLMTPEPSFLYSSRSFWYPQAVVSDYATARIRLYVPATMDAVASGQLEPGFPVLVAAKDPRDPVPMRKLYAFITTQPVRYLAFVVSRFARVETTTIGFPPSTTDEDAPLQGRSYQTMNLSVEANPRQVSKGHDLEEKAADIALFYQSLLGDSPYGSFTVALVESDLPGGHSPAYFASLNQPLPTAQLSWRNDPAAFNSFPEFFIAHEMAHQWWGQAVGWRNYHEQWLSEGFAQYFAALYAQHLRGDETFDDVMKQIRHWAVDMSDQGPVYLGYRLGHIRGEGRVFRALVYNKGAAVLHMLRIMVGDDAFFDGLRRYYRTMRFKKAGTEDLRQAMETASGQNLERFFERWVYNATLPRVRITSTVDGRDVVLHVEQLGEDLFDFPLIVTIQYADRKPATVVIPVTDREVDRRIPLAGTLRGVSVDRDASMIVNAKS